MLDPLPAALRIEPDDTNHALYKQRTRMFLVDNERGKKFPLKY